VNSDESLIRARDRTLDFVEPETVGVDPNRSHESL
jgi:hypothetical protein